jgi:hypothetical protein
LAIRKQKDNQVNRTSLPDDKILPGNAGPRNAMQVTQIAESPASKGHRSSVDFLS